MDYTLRFYRDWVKEDDLTTFRVKVGETDLSIRAHSDLTDDARKLVKRFRTDIELYAETHPGFLEALTPQSADAQAPAIVAEMIRHSAAYGVGPMATVAGAMAQAVGRLLLSASPEVIVENGGDVFLQMNRRVKLMLYSGEESPFAKDVVIAIDAPGKARGVCTSSARVGPSLSSHDSRRCGPGRRRGNRRRQPHQAPGRRARRSRRGARARRAPRGGHHHRPNLRCLRGGAAEQALTAR